MITRFKLSLAFTFIFGAFFLTSAFAASDISTTEEPQMSTFNNKNDDKDGIDDGNAGDPKERTHNNRKHGHAE